MSRESANPVRLLLILGHPRTESLSYALGRAYEEGAKEAGAEVQRLELASIDFDPHVREESPNTQRNEEDLQHAQSLIRWANHIVFVYPTWWGTVPALVKGFLDRVLTSGFAFNEVEGGTGYEGLLKDKSAQVITTMDTPQWVYNWIYGRPGHNAMQRATLGFCGISPVKISAFGPVRSSTEDDRTSWLREVREEGRELDRGRLTHWDQFKRKLISWLKAFRLQFYPMTLIAYTVGALAVAQGGFNAVYLIGFMCLFFIELATVLTNDYFDFQSDRANEYYSPFTGGSRVIVEGDLSFKEIKAGAIISLFGVAVATVLLLLYSPASAAIVLTAIGLLSLLALGYTVPPLKLSYRGLGELDVALTHSAGAVLTGFIFQGGLWHDPLPWLLSIPLFLSVLPAIILAGIPDRYADRIAGKRTLAVRLGRRRSAYLASGLTVIAAISGLIWFALPLATGVLGLLIIAVAHGLFLAKRLADYAGKTDPPERIDNLLALALSYILWFGIIPLIGLL